MTIQELFDKLHPSETHPIVAQILTDGLHANITDLFTRLIKDAARCNSYSSDVYPNLRTIDESLRAYRPGQNFTPIFIGFRRHGVDGNGFILSRLELDLDGDIYKMSREYFALYSINVVPDKDITNWAVVVWNEYWM